MGYEPGDDIHVTRGVKYAKIISNYTLGLEDNVAGHYARTDLRSGVATNKSKMAVTCWA